MFDQIKHPINVSGTDQFHTDNDQIYPFHFRFPRQYAVIASVPGFGEEVTGRKL